VTFRYDGLTAVVTGAASGIGAATTMLLADSGAAVWGLDKQPASSGEWLQVDLARPEDVDRFVTALPQRPDAVFCCAGLPSTHPGIDVMVVNFCGHRHLLESLIPDMPSGSAIAIVVSAGALGQMKYGDELAELVATPDFRTGLEWCRSHSEVLVDAYGFSKAALLSWQAARCSSLLGRGIRVNCLTPGPVETPMMRAFEEALGKSYMDNFPRPIGRNSTAVEQAYPLLFLNSPAASYVAGHNLFADGGFYSALQSGEIDPAVTTPWEQKGHIDDDEARGDL
jgi:NAD(P)-dependent dehydrogenase (short-subunit alcohol dehydrogenase family)